MLYLIEALALRQIRINYRAPNVRLMQLNVAEVGSAEVGSEKVGSAEVGSAEVGLLQRGNRLVLVPAGVPFLYAVAAATEEFEGFFLIHGRIVTDRTPGGISGRQRWSASITAISISPFSS